MRGARTSQIPVSVLGEAQKQWKGGVVGRQQAWQPGRRGPPRSPNLGALDKPPCSLTSVSPLVIGDIKGLSWAKDTTHLHKTKQKRE